MTNDFAYLICALGSIAFTEFVFRVPGRSLSSILKFATRTQYPLWILISLGKFHLWEIPILIGIYTLGCILLTVRHYNRIFDQEGRMMLGRRFRRKGQVNHAEETQYQIEYLRRHGCPAGLRCQQMGGTPQGTCSNFAACKKSS